MKAQILKAIEAATGEKCGTVTYDAAAKDWRITGVFEADSRAIMTELEKIGLRRKASASGFYVER
jgi:hypothetical protein